MNKDAKELIGQLVEEATKVRAHAHAPYSRYKVGAALVTKKGSIYTGCNVENASYGATVCAERNAIAAMVAAGEKEPLACAIVTQGPTPAAPCGMCRQVLAEFANDMVLALAVPGKTTVIRHLAELLPEGFRGKSLTKSKK